MFNCYLGVGIISSVLGFLVAGIMEKKATEMVDEMQGKFSDEGDEIALGLMSKICNAIPIPRHVCIAFGLMLFIKCLAIIFFTHSDAHPIRDGDSYVACPGDTESLYPTYNATGMFDADYMAEPFCKDNHMVYFTNLLTVVYMTSVSMTSVGYGDFSPQSEGARVFAIFWIMLGTLLNANAWGSLTAWLLQCYQEQLDKKKTVKVFDAKSIMQIDKDQGGEVDELEFVTHMLLKTNKVDQLTLADIRRQFEELDASGDGIITKEDIALLESKQTAEAEAKLQTPVEPITTVPLTAVSQDLTPGGRITPSNIES